MKGAFLSNESCMQIIVLTTIHENKANKRAQAGRTVLFYQISHMQIADYYAHIVKRHSTRIQDGLPALKVLKQWFLLTVVGPSHTYHDNECLLKRHPLR